MFDLGKCLITHLARDFFLEDATSTPLDLLRGHQDGSLWAHNREQNELAILIGDRVFTSWKAQKETIFVITEADRSCTTICLASEY